MFRNMFRLGRHSSHNKASFVLRCFWIFHISITGTYLNGWHVNLGFGVLGFEISIGLSKWKNSYST